MAMKATVYKINKSQDTKIKNAEIWSSYQEIAC